jgi:hypothetical protein
MTAIPVRDLVNKIIPLPVRYIPREGKGKHIPATPLTAEQKKAADLCAAAEERGR